MTKNWRKVLKQNVIKAMFIILIETKLVLIKPSFQSVNGFSSILERSSITSDHVYHISSVSTYVLLLSTIKSDINLVDQFCYHYNEYPRTF